MGKNQKKKKKDRDRIIKTINGNKKKLGEERGGNINANNN
jgi:hypothetical protein